ncbi:MAG: DUF4878 domain-containing protein [Lutibacter sp.]|uniref:DUF4878 domain-containing protein n=1 Tax=Lutibacter sp. TaxID=1925666 RepID=UPI00299F23C7|nr:DUF4878 domain-containing protein [Lutibacter sp.]MDX1829117.1 DUF4878 domain-containing protein [Lutibacter sp.]
MKNSTFYLTLLVLVISISLTSCGKGGSDTPSKAVIALFDSMKNKDFEKSAAMFVNNKGKKLSKEEAKKIEGLIGMMAKEYEKKGGFDKVTIDEEKINKDGNSAKVYYTTHYKNGKTKKDNMNLIKVNDKWVFEAFHGFGN